jgi:hypothetical protein
MNRILDIAFPMVAVGLAALAARLAQSSDSSNAAFYLVPLGLALATGLLRPGLLGSIGAGIGWSIGLALGWLIVAGDFWLGGAAVYALIAALVPHAIGSTIRTVLRPRLSLVT